MVGEICSRDFGGNGSLLRGLFGVRKRSVGACGVKVGDGCYIWFRLLPGEGSTVSMESKFGIRHFLCGNRITKQSG